MRSRRLAIAAVVVASGALAFAGSARACSCAPTSKREALRQADAAIAGRLLDVAPRGHDRAVYRYRIRHVYKPGPGIRRGGTVAVWSARDSAACGLPAGLGSSYGLALTRTGRGWTSGACALMRDCPS